MLTNVMVGVPISCLSGLVWPQKARMACRVENQLCVVKI